MTNLSYIIYLLFSGKILLDIYVEKVCLLLVSFSRGPSLLVLVAAWTKKIDVYNPNDAFKIYEVISTNFAWLPLPFRVCCTKGNESTTKLHLFIGLY